MIGRNESLVLLPAFDEDVIRISASTLTFCASVFCVNLFVGSVINVCVMWTIWRTKSLRVSSINWAVLSLCSADLLTICVDVPITIWILSANFFNFQVTQIEKVRLINCFNIDWKWLTLGNLTLDISLKQGSYYLYHFLSQSTLILKISMTICFSKGFIYNS